MVCVENSNGVALNSVITWIFFAFLFSRLVLPDLMHIKTSVIKHLPLLIFGRKQGETPKEVQAERGTPKMTLSSLSSAGKPRQEVMSESDAALITSVYFDNDDVEMYTRRIHQV